MVNNSWMHKIFIHFLAFLFTGWCQTFSYLRYIWSFLSVWYVVSFTIERYIAGQLHRVSLCHVIILFTP